MSRVRHGRVAQAFDLAGMAKSARCQECSAVFSWREASAMRFPRITSLRRSISIRNRSFRVGSRLSPIQPVGRFQRRVSNRADDNRSASGFESPRRRQLKTRPRGPLTKGSLTLVERQTRNSRNGRSAREDSASQGVRATKSLSCFSRVSSRLNGGPHEYWG